jgi:hypothetical protein
VLPNRKSTPPDDAAVCIAFRDIRDTHACEKIGWPFLDRCRWFLCCLTFALEVTEPASAAHGYPALYNLDGKKLADGSSGSGWRIIFYR